jgi:hypothetical protein
MQGALWTAHQLDAIDVAGRHSLEPKWAAAHIDLDAVDEHLGNRLVGAAQPNARWPARSGVGVHVHSGQSAHRVRGAERRLHFQVCTREDGCGHTEPMLRRRCSARRHDHGCESPRRARGGRVGATCGIDLTGERRHRDDDGAQQYSSDAGHHEQSLKTRYRVSGLRRLIPFFAANALFASVLGFHSFLYNFYLDGLRLSPEIMGRAARDMVLGGLLCCCRPGSVDRWGPKAVIVGAALCAAIGLAWSAIATSAPTIYAASALAGAAGVSWRVAQAPVLMELSTTENRSRLFTLDVAFLVGSGAAATALSGALVGRIEQWRHVGHETALTIVLVVGALVTGLSAIVYSTLDLPSAARKNESRASPRCHTAKRDAARRAERVVAGRSHAGKSVLQLVLRAHISPAD